MLKQHKAYNSISIHNTADYKASNIEYVCNPVQLCKYEQELNLLGSDVKQIYAFHGSSKQNYDSILQTHFYKPGHTKYISTTGNNGCFGGGSYFSLKPAICLH